MTPIYDAGWQYKKVRFVQVVSTLCGAAAIWGGAEVFRSYGLHPTEGGELAPLGVRLLLGGAFAALGVLIVAGIWIYLHCYVARVEADEAREGLQVTLPGFFLSTRLEVKRGEVLGAKWNHGQLRTSDHRVNAPWHTIRLAGRRLPLILDAQGDFLDREAVGVLLLGETPRPPRKAPRPRPAR